MDRPNTDDQDARHQAGRPGDPPADRGGLNINVTLLFGIDAYLAVAEAFLPGWKALKAAGAIERIGGVASFFVSRIDTQIDGKIDARVRAGDAAASALKR